MLHRVFNVKHVPKTKTTEDDSKSNNMSKKERRKMLIKQRIRGMTKLNLMQPTSRTSTSTMQVPTTPNLTRSSSVATGKTTAAAANMINILF